MVTCRQGPDTPCPLISWVKMTGSVHNTAYDVKLLCVLNSQGKSDFWVYTIDPEIAYTALRLDDVLSLLWSIEHFLCIKMTASIQPLHSFVVLFNLIAKALADLYTFVTLPISPSLQRQKQRPLIAEKLPGFRWPCTKQMKQTMPNNETVLFTVM